MKTNSLVLTATGALAALLSACATTAPSQLVKAREAYVTSTGGLAAKLTPTELYDAKKVLDRANLEFEQNGDTLECRDFAYIAHRKVELADVKARTELDRQKIDEAVKAGVIVRDTQVRNTQAALASTREQLKDERRDNDVATNEMRAANAAATNQMQAANTAATNEMRAANNAQTSALRATNDAQSKELVQSAAQLEAEKTARLAAEAKLAGAMKDLAAIAAVKEEARGVVITLSGSVLFASGKHDLLNTAMTKLDQVAEALKAQDGNKRMVVEGHTDSQGSDSTNQPLSLNRATSVRNYLVSRGVASDKISAIGLGASRPVTDNKTAEDRANNRRVEIIIGSGGRSSL